MDSRVSLKNLFLGDFCSPKVQFTLARKKLSDTLKNENKKKLNEDLKFRTQQKNKVNSIKASRILNEELFLSSRILRSTNTLKTQPNSICSLTYYLKNEAKILDSFKQNNIYDIKLRDILNKKLYTVPNEQKEVIFRNTEVKTKMKPKSMQKMRKSYEIKVNTTENFPLIKKNVPNEIVYVITKKNNYRIC